MDGKDYAMQLLLIGAALADSEKSKLIKERFTSEMLSDKACEIAFQAILDRDRDMIERFLKMVGVKLGADELAIDAVARTVLQRAMERHQRVLDASEAAMEFYA